jgi:hypothetical protein
MVSIPFQDTIYEILKINYLGHSIQQYLTFFAFCIGGLILGKIVYFPKNKPPYAECKKG